MALRLTRTTPRPSEHGFAPQSKTRMRCNHPVYREPLAHLLRWSASLHVAGVLAFLLLVSSCRDAASTPGASDTLSKGQPDNRLRALYPDLPPLTDAERAALRELGVGWRRMILAQAIIGTDPTSTMLTDSFAKHELPALMKDASPANKAWIEKLARSHLDAMRYAYKASRGFAWDGADEEVEILRTLLRLEENSPIRDSQFAQDRMMMVNDDLLEIAAAPHE